jgi:hypothetical protein
LQGYGAEKAFDRMKSLLATDSLMLYAQVLLLLQEGF